MLPEEKLKLFFWTGFSNFGHRRLCHPDPDEIVDSLMLCIFIQQKIHHPAELRGVHS